MALPGSAVGERVATQAQVCFSQRSEGPGSGLRSHARAPPPSLHGRVRGARTAPRRVGSESHDSEPPTSGEGLECVCVGGNSAPGVARQQSPA